MNDLTKSIEKLNSLSLHESEIQIKSKLSLDQSNKIETIQTEISENLSLLIQKNKSEIQLIKNKLTEFNQRLTNEGSK